MHRWAACPGSVALCAGVPGRSSVHADEGTKAHEVAACRLLGKSYTTPPDMEQWNAIDVYVQYCNSLPVFTASWVEQRFDISKLYPEGPNLFGTADFCGFEAQSKMLHVVDYKHGAGVPVEVKGNQQLRYYALGALLTLKVPARKVRMTIVQPRCPHPDGPIRSEDIDVIDLLDFASDLVEAVKATEDPAARLVAGVHCRWCPASAICPERKLVAFTAVQKDFKASPTVLADVLERIDEIEAWCKSVRAYAYDEAQAGRSPPGWKLVDKRPVRSFVDPEQARAWLLSKGFARNEIYEEPNLKSPAQIEKITRMTADLRAEMTEIVKKESSGTKLVKEEDPSPATSMFTPV